MTNLLNSYNNLMFIHFKIKFTYYEHQHRPIHRHTSE